MPSFSPNFQTATYAADVAYVRRDGLKLRLRDAGGAYAPFDGAMAESAVVTFTAMPIPALVPPLFSFVMDATVPTGASIGWQFSVDGGTSWLWWDGDSWSATEASYNTIEDVQANIGTLIPSASAGVTLSVRARLSSDETRRVGPVLKACAFVGEVDQRIVADASESLRAYLCANLVAKTKLVQRLGETGTTFTLDTPFNVAGVSRVVNRTTDPAGAVNLFDSVAGKVVTLSGEQEAPAVLESWLSVTIPPATSQPNAGPNIRVGNSEDDIFKASVPALGILIAAAERDATISGGSGPTEINRGTLRARVRRASDVKRVTANLYAMTAGPNAERDGEALGAALTALLGRPGAWFPSLYTSQAMKVVGFTGYSSADQVGDGLYAKRADVVFMAREYDGDYTETSVFQRVNLYAPGGRHYTIAGA